MGRKLFLLLAVTFIFAAISPQQTQASVKTSAPSAILAGLHTNTPVQPVADNRAKILKEYLAQYDSPLAEHADTFVQEADKQNIDWKLVPAITGVESYFGQLIPPYSYNGWGYHVYDGNVRGFASWDEGIEVVTAALREDYMNAWGAENIHQIGSIYAADPLWSSKVSHFYEELSAFAEAESNVLLSISL